MLPEHASSREVNADMNHSNILTQEDLDPGLDGHDFPAVKAAGNPTSAVLSNLLLRGWQESPFYNTEPANALALRYGPNAYMDGSLHGIYDSPLLRAIKFHRQSNVDLLLQAGADPNGQSIWSMFDYAKRFQRFRPRKFIAQPEESSRSPEERLEQQISLESGEITQNEIDEGCSRFWAEKDFPPLSFAASNAAMTAVEMAAREGSIDALQAVLARGPDVSFWLLPRMPLAISSSHSALSISSPVHGAVEERQSEMLKILLSYGYDPNLLPTAAITRCLSPLMTALACDPPNITAFNILVSHPEIDLSLRSPIYGVHPLHLAAAHLSIPLLEEVSAKIPLETAGATALGFTLLHIVCLPLTAAELNRTSNAIITSITRLRSLSTKYLSDGIASKTDLPLQTASARYVLRNTSCNVFTEDIFGNTPLHYLAAYRTRNEELIAWLRSQESNGMDSWKNVKNRWGWSAEKLSETTQTENPESADKNRPHRGRPSRGRGRDNR